MLPSSRPQKVPFNIVTTFEPILKTKPLPLEVQPLFKESASSFSIMDIAAPLSGAFTFGGTSALGAKLVPILSGMPKIPACGAFAYGAVGGAAIGFFCQQRCKAVYRFGSEIEPNYSPSALQSLYIPVYSTLSAVMSRSLHQLAMSPKGPTVSHLALAAFTGGLALWGVGRFLPNISLEIIDEENAEDLKKWNQSFIDSPEDQPKFYYSEVCKERHEGYVIRIGKYKDVNEKYPCYFEIP